MSGHTLQACKPCTCPSWRWRKRAHTQQQRHQWFSGWGSLTCLKEGPGVTCHRVAEGSQGMAAVSSRSWGEGEVTSIRLAHQLPGKQAEGHAPHLPFDKLSRWRCSDLKVRVIISRSRGQGKVSPVSRVQVKQALCSLAGDVQRAREQPSLVA